MTIFRGLLTLIWLCLAAISANAEVKLAAPVLVTGQLDNGLIYSLYPSDDSQTPEHEEDVSLTMNVRVAEWQETAEQLGTAKMVGNAAGDYFGYSRDGLTEFYRNIIDIEAVKMTDELMVFKNIATGEFYNQTDADMQGKVFLAKWYQPQFMHLSVAGQIDVAQVEQQIKQIFGGLKSTPILRTPRAFYAPVKGLSQVVKPQSKANILRILLGFNWQKANLTSFDPAVISVTIRSHMRIQANQQDDIEYAQAYFDNYDGKDYIQIDLAHNGTPLKSIDWAFSEVAAIRKMGITKNHLSGFRMWLKAEAIDHFSPFKPDGNPSQITSQLAYRQTAVPPILTNSDEESQLADEYLKNMDYRALDKSLKLVLGGEMRIVSIQNSNLTDNQIEQLKKRINGYNLEKYTD